MGQTNDVRDAVEDELTFDPDVDASHITVENTDGTVSLNGTVPSYPQYVAAAAGARRVAGVKSVRNHLEVALPAGDYRDDALLTAAANNALTLNNTMPCGVEATAAKGTLTLTGAVRDTTERAAAEALVAGLTGVHSVKNDIQTRDGAAPADGRQRDGLGA
jgi:osmotically-inducible protein OsmY